MPRPHHSVRAIAARRATAASFASVRTIPPLWRAGSIRRMLLISFQLALYVSTLYFTATSFALSVKPEAPIVKSDIVRDRTCKRCRCSACWHGLASCDGRGNLDRRKQFVYIGT
jgi:hypothetical protein